MTADIVRCLKAKTIAIPGSTGGIWLTTDVFPRLGMAEKINVKSTPRGTAATDMVAAGEADIAVMPVSEILHAAGVDFVGTIPPEIQLAQVFSAAVVAAKLPVSTTAARTLMPPSNLPSNAMMISCHLSMDKDALAASQRSHQMCRA